MHEPPSGRARGRRDFVGAACTGLGVGAGLFRRWRGAWSANSGPTNLTILHTTDIHGQLESHDEFFIEGGRPVFKRRGGFASLKTLIRGVRDENRGPVLLVDGGDLLHGSAVASLSEGRALVPLINDLGYDLILPGNWEVVYGKAGLLRGFEGYAARTICANMFHEDRDELLFPAHHVFDLGGVRVGFIGYNDPMTPIRQSPAYSRGIRFARPDASLAGHVRYLRQDQGCAVVCVLSHLGLLQQLDLASQPDANGVDYVLGGDTHERVRTPLNGGFARVTEPGAFGSFVGRLDLAVEGGRVVDERYQLLEVDPDRYPPDATMADSVAAARAPFEPEITRVIGQTSTPLLRYYTVETSLDNLITDALMDRFKTDLVLSNGFRFCPPLVPGPSGIADITMEYLWSMLPVDSLVKAADVPGDRLLAWLERELENAFASNPAQRFGGWLVRFSGMKLRFRIKAPVGKRVVEASVGGRPISKDRVYSVVACEREGDPESVLCRITNVANPRALDVKLHEVIIRYLAEHSPVSPRVEGRAVAIDAPAGLLSAFPGTGYHFR